MVRSSLHGIPKTSRSVRDVSRGIASNVRVKLIARKEKKRKGGNKEK